MQPTVPPPPQNSSGSLYTADIVWDLIWTLLTCGLYNIYIQSRQIKALNAMLGQEKYHFGWWALFTLITCGLYHIYHEYRMSVDIIEVCKEPNSQLPLVSLISAGFGFPMVADAIQQSHINRFYGVNKV